ncbi:hypothetical protein H4Q26_015421 [Puccinia striiformis f. sp. tritici PST-130]|nr:hypothetical protein H4Q26_015421 [Puccinia striiformis f. sp. tritici PST-130]
MDKQQLKRKSPAEEKEEEEDNIKKIKTGHHHQTSKSVVELDKSRASLNIKQKPIELCEVSNQIKRVEDQTIAELTKYVHSKLLPQTKLLIDEDEDQELKKPFDPLPLSVIESSINQVAKRVNYAPVQADLDWLPSNLPKQKSSTPNSPIKTPKLKSSASSSQTGKESEDKVTETETKDGKSHGGWMSKSTPSSDNKKLASSSNQTLKTMTDPKQEGIEITAFFKNGVKQPSLKSQCSDFEKTFKAFNRKPNVQLAPINRFRPPSSATRSNIENLLLI